MLATVEESLADGIESSGGTGGNVNHVERPTEATSLEPLVCTTEGMTEKIQSQDDEQRVDYDDSDA